jgi:outer membrane protein TolC
VSCDKQLLLHASLFFWLSLYILFFAPPVSAQNNSIKLLECVQAALKHQVQIDFSQLDIENAQAIQQEAAGEFDTTIQTTARHGETETPLSTTEQHARLQDDLRQIDSQYSIGLSKEFRPGVSLSPQIQTTRSEVQDSPATPTSSSGIYLVATIPLLRGLGTEANAALETAAELDIQNSRADLKHTMNQVVRDVTTAYWQYVYNYQQLQQYRSAEQRARELYEQTKLLVEGDELPAAEMDEVRANLAEKETTVIASEQNLLQSRQELGLAMGVSFSRIRSLPPPADPFDIIKLTTQGFSHLNETALISHAVQNRPDLLASKGREESAAVREKYFENQLLPQMDIGMKVGYEGLEEDKSYRSMIQSPYSNVPGASWQVSLTYEFPIANRLARGQLAQQRVDKRRQMLTSRELSRTIQSNVHTSISVLYNARQELENARQTVDLYNQAVENQLMKYKMGMGTQIDVITTQDNLTQARLNKVNAQFKYAQALTDLRYQTSTLLSFAQDQAKVGLEHLTRLPLTIQ